MREISIGLVSALLCLATPVIAAEANPFNSATPYEACLDAVDADPDDGWEKAYAWREAGGGLPADHCAAEALLALGYYVDAAVRFGALARNERSGTAGQRAALFASSGNAFLLADQAFAAAEEISEALKLSPRDPNLWKDRARARAGLHDWPGAEADLTAALQFEQNDPELYVLRASALTAQGRAGEARVNLDAALELDPSYPSALVDRGAMRLAEGDVDGARADWIEVLRTAPQSAAADSARAHIEALEVNPDL